MFTHEAAFTMYGDPCNLFLLDISSRMVASFVSLPSTRTVVLYLLPDWDEDVCSFIDTGIKWVRYDVFLTVSR